jgi:hypothetical protein
MHDFRRGEYGEYGVRTNPLAHAWFSCYSLEMRYGKVNLKPGVLISFQLFEVPFKLSTTLSIWSARVNLWLICGTFYWEQIFVDSAENDEGELLEILDIECLGDRTKV